jgi:hypothetical protein
MHSPIAESKEAIWTKVRRRVVRAAGKTLEFCHVPARIREFEYVDPATNEIVYLSTGARYSVLHVGAKKLFFDRVTGRFDGTGELLLQERVADRLELLD